MTDQQLAEPMENEEVVFAIHPNNFLDDWDAFSTKDDEGFFSENDDDPEEEEDEEEEARRVALFEEMVIQNLQEQIYFAPNRIDTYNNQL